MPKAVVEERKVEEEALLSRETKELRMRGYHNKLASIGQGGSGRGGFDGRVQSGGKKNIGALWSITAKNTDHLLIRSLVRSHRSLVHSLAHFAHSLARGKVNF